MDTLVAVHYEKLELLGEGSWLSMWMSSIRTHTFTMVIVTKNNLKITGAALRGEVVTS